MSDLDERRERLRRYLLKLDERRGREPELGLGLIDLDASLPKEAASAYRSLFDPDLAAPSASDLSALEAIILPGRRPALRVLRGSYERVEGGELAWMNDLAIRRRVERAARAVGRVLTRNRKTGSGVAAGTGFLVGGDLLMTNMHVARDFVEGDGHAARMKGDVSVTVDFLHESSKPSDAVLAVRNVVFVHPYWDVALVELENVAPLGIEPLALDPVPPSRAEGRRIVAIGHPAKDRNQPGDVQDRVFGGNYHTKRVQPGWVIGQRTYEDLGERGPRQITTLAHDASTLAGNSGSPVIDVDSGQVIAVHFAGKYLEENYCVSAWDLGRDAEVRNAGVKFTSGASEAPSPWAREWARADGRKEVSVGVVDEPKREQARAIGAATVQSAPLDVDRAPGNSTAGTVVVHIPIEIHVRVGAPHVSKKED